MCLFVNTFREHDKKWPRDSFANWATVQHYLVAQPSSASIIKEIILCKRHFVKPFSAKMTSELCKEIIAMRVAFFEGFTEEFYLKQFNSNRHIKAIVNLVLTSLS